MPGEMRVNGSPETRHKDPTVCEACGEGFKPGERLAAEVVSVDHVVSAGKRAPTLAVRFVHQECP